MFQSKISRIIAIMLAVLMIFTVMAGCKSTEKEEEGETVASESTSKDQESAVEEEKSREPVTIKAFMNLDGPSSSLDYEIGKIIKEKFNIKFEFSLKPTNFPDQCNIWLASGDYPEVFSLPTIDLYNSYIEAGALVCLEDYLDKMPEFTKNRAEQIPLWRSHAKDGKLYKWENASPQSPAAFMDDFDAVVRTDALEKQGWPQVIYASEYIDFLKQALKDFPQTDNKNTVGLTFPGAEVWGPGRVYSMFEKGDKYSNFTPVAVANMKDEKYEFMFDLPEAKESAKFFNDLYQANLLDKECFSLKDTDVLAKMTTGQIVVDYYTRWNTAPANAGLEKNGKIESQYIELPIRLDSQKGQKRQFVQSLVRTMENNVMTKNCKDPDRFIELLDWWQTEEAQILYGSGIENVDYAVENGKRVPLEPLENYLKGQNSDWALKLGGMEQHLFANTLGGRYDDAPSDAQPYRITKDPDIVAKYGLSDRQKQAYQALGWKNHKSWYYENGEFYYDGIIKGGVSIDPASDLGKKNIQIGDIANRYASKLTFSKNDEEFEANYSAMLDEMQKLEPMKIVDEYNRLLAELMAKSK
jgi:putative aldouronate transport system substrate-binding protein